MPLREIAAKLGVDIEDGPVNAFMGKLDNAKKGILAFGAAMGLQKLGAWISSTADASFQLETMSVKTGASVKELQKLGYMLQLSGGNAADAEKLLFELNQQLTNATGSGLYYQETLRRMGIATKDAAGKNRTMTDILPEVATLMDKATTEAQRTQIAVRAFGQNGMEAMRPLLKRGSAGIRELAGEFEKLNLGMTQETVKANAQTSKEIQKLGLAAKSLSGTLVGALAPIIRLLTGLAIKLSAKILEWTKHTTVLNSVVLILKGALIAYSAVQARQMLPGLFKAIKSFMALRTAVFGASVPLWVIIAVLGALYLVFDDLYALMTGGDSLIGDLLDKFGGVGAKANLIKALKDVWENLTKSIDGMKGPLGYVMGLLGELGVKIGPTLAKVFIGVVKSIVASVAALGTLASAAAKLLDKDWEGAKNEISKGSDAIFGKKNSYWDPKTNQMVSENVGGIFGKTDAEYKSQMDAAYGKAPPPPVVNTPVNVKIDATNMAPQDALGAVKGGVAKGVQGAMDDSFGAVATFAPGGVG